MSETIEQLASDRVDWIGREFARLAWPKTEGYFQKCFVAQQRGEMIVLVARTNEQLHGYLKVVWEPEYSPFRDHGIPEVQDMNVVPVSRRKGIATRLMDTAERLIAERSPVAGIGVGLHPGYAAAQHMYVLRGYVPDAMPLTYDNQFVTEGQNVKLDDELILHLTKELKRNEANQPMLATR
jgi:GNAT superfamily N-acetyltransferase